MTSLATRPLHLTVSLNGSGCHLAASRVSRLPAGPNAVALREMARTAERGKLDAIWLGLPMPGAVHAMHLDPLPLLGSMIGVTRRIGLGGAWTVDFTEPYNVARVFATLDHLSYGRTAWMPQLFGTEALLPRIGREPPTHDEAGYYRRAGELADIVRKLWDSWQDEAFVVDKASGTFGDPDRVHPIKFSGEYFDVRGPLNVPRPPQGNPVIVMADPQTRLGQQFVAATAEVILTTATSLPQARARYRALRDAAESQGRSASGLRILADLPIILDRSAAAAERRAAELDALCPSAEPVPRFVGTPKQLVEHLAVWRAEGACDGFNLKPAVLPDDLDLLVDAVIPLAQRRGLARPDYAGATLREHFGLPRPRSQYEQAS